MKRKDAFTDLVEFAEENEPSKPEGASPKDRRVVNTEGEIITLGAKRGKDGELYIKAKSLELYLQRRDKKLVDIVIKIFEKKIHKEIEKMLDNRGRKK